ncbi:hypothetical protein EJ05DRAFT_540160 [Pseudovirgaria hyperparasitica]|uniref:Uncharacterized protein n=1 Tax=Pseudovirgaria hyperparasitica TaxID=470096 RepID=A0A6A6VZV1_9PEZI|nr:uncharacterized protein EJ05DRAFT_540160 [Pseudovirgaria hyperparasitica]KAF2755419.1 hypothetical protein EJ05DRAFT_540160 [Pseudovirgaria hyperparasitica]
MQFTITAVVALLAPFALGANIVATNNCRGSIFVKPDANGYSGPISEIRQGQTWTGNLETGRQGNAVKFSNNRNDFTKPISFDYTVTNGVNYYDVSNAAGTPFSLSAQDSQQGGQCQAVACPSGSCKQVKTCSSQRSFAIRAC